MFFFFLKVIITVSFYLVLGKLTVFKILKYENNNSIDYSIIGIISVSIIALIVNFILPLNLFINSIFFFIFFIIFFIFKQKLKNFDYLFILVVSLLTFLIILFDNEFRPDAGLYHLPYIQILNENNILFGLVNVHSRFGHISIIQYLSAFNLNIFTNKIGIIIPSAIIFSLIYLYFLNDIYKFIKKKDKFSLGKIFSIFIIIYISYKINRYSEFGNDAPAHLLFFYLISKFIYFEKNSFKTAHNLYLYSAYLFLNKVFFIFTFILPIYFVIKNKKLFFKLSKSIPSLILFFWILKNILISGCILFPMKISCFSSLQWTNIELTEKSELEADAWTKAWPQNLDKKLSMKEFTKNFKWLDAWTSVHFKYITKLLLPYLIFITLILIYTINVKKKSLNNLITNEKYFYLLLLSIIGVAGFFLKFSIYRYGYSYLIIFFFMISFWSFKFINKEKFLNICKIILPLSLVVIFSKQLLRYQKNYNKINYVPNHIFINEEKYDEKYNKIILSNNFPVYYSKTECFYGLSPCTNYRYGADNKEIKHKKKLIFNIIYPK